MNKADDTISTISSLLLWSSSFLVLSIVIIGDIDINLYLFVVLTIVAAIVIMVISEISSR